MKRLVYAVSFVVFFALTALLPQTQAQSQCAKIKDGTITDTAGNVIGLGYDQFGYNYQAHMFNGTYDSVDRVLDRKYYGQAGDFTDDALIMKWSEEWLSNQSCDDNSTLDRGGDGTDLGSRGWLTNQVEGDYLGNDGESHHYTYFVKFVWVDVAPIAPDPDPWSGVRIWGEFAIIQEIYNDPYGGFHGVDRTKLANPAGFGFYTN